MSSGSGADDCCARRPTGDESNATIVCMDAEAAAVAAPGAELGRGGVQLGGAAVDGLGARAMLLPPSFHLYFVPVETHNV